MDIFLKTTGGILVAVVLRQVLNKQDKNIGILLAIIACCMIAATAMGFLEQVISLLNRIIAVGELNTQILSTVLKAVGIGMISEITILICNDSGNAALGKSLQILASAVILWLSIPIFTEMIDLLESVLGAI